MTPPDPPQPTTETQAPLLERLLNWRGGLTFNELSALLREAASAIHVVDTRDMICEIHPELPWPHGNCAGPGCPIDAAARLQWLHRRDLSQQVSALGVMVADGKIRIDELEQAEAQVTAELDRLREFVDTLNDRSLDDLKEGRSIGAFAGDIYDAPDDCETHIIVTRGELRAALQPEPRTAKEPRYGVGTNEVPSLLASCLDCGRDYSDFHLDMLLPRPQWLEIHPDENGLLCAQCIVTRASRVLGVTAIHAILEIAPHRRSAPAPLEPDPPHELMNRRGRHHWWDRCTALRDALFGECSCEAGECEDCQRRRVTIENWIVEKVEPRLEARWQSGSIEVAPTAGQGAAPTDETIVPPFLHPGYIIRKAKPRIHHGVDCGCCDCASPAAQGPADPLAPSEPTVPASTIRALKEQYQRCIHGDVAITEATRHGNAVLRRVVADLDRLLAGETRTDDQTRTGGEGSDQP